ncbi:Lrp/AsnC family transcriptional regulator [Halorarum salinum]|uniref:Winged helix-turn-helix transcriptional regulator n=1 Tax=Halorarum salinum TaxID=2743089 RepID=A0A7D5QBQ1_9EURY|nr:winged helix-turn-helix transcriptional regulator [Halobaculum salinum]QLG62738.1 winged helix-turn-helix transcriptional regulator [Halobaculum salinum]
MEFDLDRADMGILHVLQTDARNATTESIGERVGLASSTVATRIRNLEDSGVIKGYSPIIDYEKAGFDQRILLTGTIRPDDSGRVLEEASNVANVISVRELMTDEENVHVELVSPTQERAESVVDELNEIGVDVVETRIVKGELERSFNHFGNEYVREK